MGTLRLMRRGTRHETMAIPRTRVTARRRRQRHGLKFAFALLLLILAIGTAAAGLGPAARGATLLVKAELAQWLIARAWHENRRSGKPVHRPWPWADLSPVAHLSFVRLNEHRVVLDNDTARTLAFGPGLRAGTPPPAQGGNSVISAHRDTHFAVLGKLRHGDAIRIQPLTGETAHYRVSGRRIVDVDESWVANDHGRDELTLVTCWPLDALAAGGRQRLVVTATRVTNPES